MNIRSRLNISFSILIIITISTFALISYFVLKDTLENDRDSIFKYRISKTAETLENIIKNNINEIEGVMLKHEELQHKIEQYDSWDESDRSAVRTYFRDKLIDNAVLSTIAVLDSEGRVVLKDGEFIKADPEQIRDKLL